MKKKVLLLKLILPILTPIIIFIILFSKINLLAVMGVLKNANVLLISIAIILSILSNLLLTSDSWRRVLKILKCNLSLKKAFFIRAASYPIKCILPLNSGDLTRAIYLKRRNLLSFKKSVSSLIFNDILFFLALLFFILLGLILNRSLFGVIFFFFLIIIIPLFLLRVKKIRDFVYYILRIIHYKFYRIVRELMIIFEKVSLKKTMKLISYSILIEGIILLEYYLLFRSLGVNASISTIILFIPIIILVSFIPITTSGFGVREASVVLLFSQYAPEEFLLSIGLLISFVDYVVPAIVGLFFIKSFLSKILK